MHSPPVLAHACAVHFNRQHPLSHHRFKLQINRLGNRVYFYTFCPMDMTAPSYAMTVTENDCLDIKSFTNNRASQPGDDNLVPADCIGHMYSKFLDPMLSATQPPFIMSSWSSWLLWSFKNIQNIHLDVQMQCVTLTVILLASI